MSSEINLTVGEKIAYFRKQKGLSQEALGIKLNKSRATINNYESDRIELTNSQLKEIAEILEIDLSDITATILKDKSDQNIDDKNKELETEIKILRNEVESQKQVIEANKKIIELYEQDLAHYKKLLDDNEKLYNAIMKTLIHK